MYLKYLVYVVCHNSQFGIESLYFSWILEYDMRFYHSAVEKILELFAMLFQSHKTIK